MSKLTPAARRERLENAVRHLTYALVSSDNLIADIHRHIEGDPLDCHSAARVLISNGILAAHYIKILAELNPSLPYPKTCFRCGGTHMSDQSCGCFDNNCQ